MLCLRMNVHTKAQLICRSENVCGPFGLVLPTRGVNVQSDWTRLFRMARATIEQVNSEQQIIDHWTFGGGTAMMLQINHRESNDVDIFLRDAQLLSFLDPRNFSTPGSATSILRSGRAATKATARAF
jgi:nucleotidyltransferase AbiEii toxin of type IV toxin-antitoxin system